MGGHKGANMSVQSSAVDWVGTARDEVQDACVNVTWRLVPVFCLCYLAAFLDRINVVLATRQMLNALGGFAAP